MHRPAARALALALPALALAAGAACSGGAGTGAASTTIAAAGAGDEGAAEAAGSDTLAAGAPAEDAASAQEDHPDVTWRGDFATGDLSQWSGAQSAAPRGKAWDESRLAVQPAGDFPAGHVLRVRIEHGDRAYNVRHDPPVPLNNRSELVRARPLLREGDERWYRFQVHFPDGFAVDDGRGGGAVFLQWHHVNGRDEPGSPPILFSATTDDLRIVAVPGLGSTDARPVAAWPHQKGRWRDLVVRMRFSSDPGQGLVEAWCDGEPVASVPVATLFPGYDAYLKMGLYRRPSAKETNVVWFAGMVEAVSAAGVGFAP